MPRGLGDILINLDATQLPEGPLATWTNTGTHPGDFTSDGTEIPQVATVSGVRGVSFLGGTSGPDGTHYVGPDAFQLSGATPRTVEAWVFNPSQQGEEAVFGWGRRGGPNGSNVSFGHGIDASFGAVGHWGAADDIGWNGAASFGRWTHIAYTFDGLTTAVYTDGQLANSKPTFLDTWGFDNTELSNLLRFRVARQNEADGTASGVGVGEITIARIRVHNLALLEQDILQTFNDEADTFGLGDLDEDGLPNWYEALYDFLDPNNPDDADLDEDEDGLSNLREYERETDPENPDTDGDGLTDGDEVDIYNTDPLLADTDGDGLSDGDEINVHGTEPLFADTDGDTFGDYQEIVHGSNPLIGSEEPDADRGPVIALDATAFETGPLPTWDNTGVMGGAFTSSPEVPNVVVAQQIPGVQLNGSTHFYTGPGTPGFLAGNSNRTIEAWILNPAAADEETIFSWGRRGGPDGSNVSFNHGLNATYGAVGHWGAPDIGWGDPANVLQGQWTHVAYTYDAVLQTTRVYSNGIEVNFEELATPLNTHALDTLGRPLPFRVGSQNEANGDPTGGLRGSMTIGELRVYDRVVSGTDLQASFTAGADKYGTIDYDGDGIPTWFERLYSFLDPNIAADAALDEDEDDLSNLEEYLAGTDIENPDTDGDGISDGDEVKIHGTNPLNADTDQDGLTDGRELEIGTSPLIPDSDFDGFTDGQEVFRGSDPMGATTPNFDDLLPFVTLDATELPLGPLEAWPNTGAMGGVFNASENAIASVTSIDGIRGVTLNGAEFYTGPAAPVFVGGGNSWSVDAWIYNPAANTEETLVAWGRRGGPDGTNVGIFHGTNGTWGAMELWGGPDTPWGANAEEIAQNVVQGAWTHVGYTHDGLTQSVAVYSNGSLAFSKVLPAPLNIFNVDNAAVPRPLPFRVGIQNSAAGSTDGQFGSLSIAKVRIYDQSLTAAQMTELYSSEVEGFTVVAAPSIDSIAVDEETGAVTIQWEVASGRTYTVQYSSELENWEDLATGLDSGSFTETPNFEGDPVRFYRVIAE